MALTRATDKIIANADGNLNLSGIVTATSFSGSGANLTSLPAANLTGTLPAISGANLTGIDATAIKFGSDVKIQANNSGATVTGILTVSGNLSVGGTITYEDVTNIDSVGVITARNGIKIGPAAGVAGTFFADGSYVTAGIITATSFSGSGANLTGISQVGGSTGVDFNDNVKIRLGTGNDLQIYHNANDSLISNGTGNLYIQTADSTITLQRTNGEKFVRAISDGAVELFHDNTKHLETFNSNPFVGVSVTNDLLLNSSGDSAVRWAVGGTASSNFKWSMYYTNSGSSLNIFDNVNSRNMASFKETGAIELNYQASKKFETTNSGCTVTGQLLVPQDFVKLNDNVRLKLGNGDDLQIYHSGSNNKIESGSQTLYLAADDLQITNGAITEACLKTFANGAVELYYDNSKKFETISTGIQTVEVVKMTHGSNGVNFKQVFEQGVGNTASCSATVPACVGGGTVTVTVMHNGNNSITTTKMFPIMIGGSGTAQLGSQIFSINHGSTASFSVNAINQGIAVTNNAGAHAKVRITFDITANV